MLLQYPDEPPRISLIESKGLDDQRQKHLIGIVQEKASQLSSSLMLVELCEVRSPYTSSILLYPMWSNSHSLHHATANLRILLHFAEDK